MSKKPCKVCGGVYVITIEGIRIMEIPNGRDGYKLVANCPNCKDDKIEESMKEDQR